MRLKIFHAVVAAALSVSCVAYADDDYDDDYDKRSKAEARAEKHCAREANDQGLRVEKIGEADRVGKKLYEVKLRVDRDRYDDEYRGNKKNKNKGDDFRVMCRYDDKSRRAQLY